MSTRNIPVDKGGCCVMATRKEKKRKEGNLGLYE
jgi:hypothetical protein